MKRYKGKEWWQLLNWNEMFLTWGMLPEHLKEKIRKAGLAPIMQ